MRSFRLQGEGKPEINITSAPASSGVSMGVSWSMGVGFPVDYGAARARFLTAANALGAEVMPQLHPQPGPKDVELAVDLAWLGPRDAARVLMVSSGMHGFEGPPGSAVQSLWLEGRAGKTLPADTAVLMVHALNPWGFAWVSRLTENNVDLNRNFIDWREPPPGNPYYHRVKDDVRVADMSLQTLMHLAARNQALAAELGPAAAQVAVDYGQYEDPEGITFGGKGPEFGHRVMSDVVAPLLAHAREIGVIDWHTGVGAYGEIAILPIDGPASANAQRIVAWWGQALVENWVRSSLEDMVAKDPNLANLPLLKTGQMKQALARWLPKARITGAIIEFGTEQEGSWPDLIYVTIYDRWLRFVDQTDRMDVAHERFRSLAAKCFVPDDLDWGRTVVRDGPRLIDEALAGLVAQV